MKNYFLNKIRQIIGFDIINNKLDTICSHHALQPHIPSTLPVVNTSTGEAKLDSLSLEEIQEIMARPLTAEQLLGAFRVLYYTHGTPELAFAAIARHDVPYRDPKWVFFVLMDLPLAFDAINMTALKKYSLPMPVTLTAGHDIEFKATVFGWPYDIYITQQIFETGRYEAEYQELFKKNIKKGDAVFDIGANIGCHTALFSYLAGEKGKVYAFEPFNKNFENLSMMVEENKLQNVILHNFAASSESRAQTIRVCDNNIGGHSIVGGVTQGHENNEDRYITVECRKLDDVFSGLDRLDFVKIDVEGHESEVLSGMKGLLERFKPKLFFELTIDKPNLKDLLNSLFSYYNQAYIFELNRCFTDVESMYAAIKAKGGIFNIFIAQEMVL